MLLKIFKNSELSLSNQELKSTMEWLLVKTVKMMMYNAIQLNKRKQQTLELTLMTKEFPLSPQKYSQLKMLLSTLEMINLLRLLLDKSELERKNSKREPEIELEEKRETKSKSSEEELESDIYDYVLFYCIFIFIYLINICILSIVLFEYYMINIK